MKPGRNRGIVKSQVGLAQLGPRGGARRAGGGDQHMLMRASEKAKKPKSIGTRVSMSLGKRRAKPVVSLPKLDLPE